MPTIDLVYQSEQGASNWTNLTNTRLNNNLYSTATNVNSEIQMVLNDLPSDAESVNSVQIIMEDIAVVSKVSATGQIQTVLRDSGANYYSEEHTYVNVSVSDSAGTVHTTSNGTDKWTVEQVNGLNIHLSLVAGSPVGSGGVIIDFLALRVDYNIPAASSIIKLSQGFVKLASGKVTI